MLSMGDSASRCAVTSRPRALGQLTAPGQALTGTQDTTTISSGLAVDFVSCMVAWKDRVT